MSSKTALPMPKMIVDKIPLRYVDQPEKLASFFKSFENYMENIRQTRERLDSTSDGFIQGTMDMISGDLKFEQGMHQECISDFSRASESFLRTQKISETQMNEGTIQVPQEILREIGRRAIYCQARITHAEALIELKKAKNVTIEERNIIKQFLELAAQAYQEEIAVNEQNDDFYHKILSQKNIYKVYIRLEEQKALIAESFSEQQYHYYQAIAQAQKAIFLGEKKIPKAYFQGIFAKIKEISIRKYTDRADYFWENGLILSANQDYDKASKLYWYGEKIYQAISKFEKRTEFDLQSMMFRVTALENDAKKELANDMDKEASSLFQKASELMQQLIKMVKQLGNSELVDLFTIQSAYFDGMKLFCTGLISYDKEDYITALKSIKIAQKSLKAVLASAREMENAPLIASCKDGLKQIETYIETLSLLTEKTEPAKETKPVEKTEPVKTTEPAKTTEPIEKTEPDKETELVDKTEPAKTTEPIEKTESDEETESDENNTNS